MNGLPFLSFTKKYIFALSLIAFFSVLAYLNIINLTQTQEDDGEIINISGRQRMLSQKIALSAVTNKVDDLPELITLMKNSHQFLISKSKSMKLKELYFSKYMSLDEMVKIYLKNAEDFVQTKDKRNLNYLLENSEKLLKRLDYATSIYQDYGDARVEKLQYRELYTLIVTLVTLLIISIFIFEPANRSINIKTKELLRQKNYLDVITNINTNAIIAVDKTFNILTFNKSAEEIFGYTAQEMLHTKLLDDRIIPSKYLKAHNLGIANFMKSGKLKNEEIVFELMGQNKNKELFPIRISFGISLENNNKIVVANIQNIAKEKEKDELILQQSRFAAMGEMIGNIAHQWRQPLSSISAMATGAKLRYKNNLITDEELENTFIKIKDQTQYLSKTIDDFRDFLKQDRTKDKFYIDDVVNKSLSLVEAVYLDHGIKLYLKPNKIKRTLHGSDSELSQVFLNILNNAKDILIDKNIENKIVCIELLEKDDFIIINIHDNGGGVPDEIKEKIFDPYFTTKHQSQGTGIGLFMSKKIVTQHYNGYINIQNKEFSFENEQYFGAEFSVKIKSQ